MDYEINFELRDATGWSKEFTSLRSLVKFIKNEHDFWTEVHEELNQNYINNNGNYLNFYRNFETVLQVLEPLLVSKEQSFEQLNQGFNIVSQHLVHMSSVWLYSKQPLTQQYIKILNSYDKEGKIAQAFLEYVLNKNTSNVTNQKYFEGYLLAYEFLNQNIELIRRRDSEKKSLTQIRNNFTNTQDSLIKEVEEFKSEYKYWEDQTKIDVGRLYKVQKYLGERKLRAQTSDFQTHLQVWNEKIIELESTYEEKLKLQGPAKYWRDAATRYEKNGMNWTRAIVFFVILGVIIFYSLLSQWFNGKPMPLQLSSLQGAILFASLAAIFTYLMKILSKMAFSSFHLMRDAQEREQLTYLYLALTHESEIDKSSRDIVLQSLFSRSETGLLAKETGPTMPTISEILPRTSRT